MVVLCTIEFLNRYVYAEQVTDPDPEASSTVVSTVKSGTIEICFANQKSTTSLGAPIRETVVLRPEVTIDINRSKLKKKRTGRPKVN